jgi:L-lactate utilization protein LutC
MSKHQLAEGLSRLKEASGHKPPAPVISDAKPPAVPNNPRQGLVQIAGHFEPAVRQQLAIMGARQTRTQLDLLAEALNDLFVKYGHSAIARVYGEGSKSRPRGAR